jgi:hypothetical protein
LARGYTHQEAGGLLGDWCLSRDRSRVGRNSEPTGLVLPVAA